MRHRRPIQLIAIALIALSLQACAARGLRNQTRVGALAVGESVLAVDSLERELYAKNIYAKDVHDAIGAGVLKALYAARGYERAIAAWPEDGTPRPDAVTVAGAAVLLALADIERAIPAVAAAREPLLRALAAVRAALEVQS